jgi:receptor expression-enhancing protein 5/6
MKGTARWLTYWIVFGCFHLVEFFIDILLSWIPFYFTAKLAFLLWCMAPIDFNGSKLIYKMVILPFFIKNETQIESINKRFEENVLDNDALKERAAKGFKIF